MWMWIKKLYTRYYTYKLLQCQKRLIEDETNVKIGKVLINHYSKMIANSLLRELM